VRINPKLEFSRQHLGWLLSLSTGNASCAVEVIVFNKHMQLSG
jgi:hypothetical protein